MVVHVLQLVIFMTKQKSLWKSSSGIFFTAKDIVPYLKLHPITWAKSLTKFNPKMQNFKSVLEFNCKKKD